MERAEGNSVVHPGTVAVVFESGVEVDITVEAACGNCKMKKACGMDESSGRRVTVVTPDARFFEPGERVEVLMKSAMGYRAIAIAYVVPVFVVLVALGLLVRAGVAEITAGLGALGFLAVYYFIIYRLRDRLGREIRFEIRRPAKNRTE